MSQTSRKLDGRIRTRLRVSNGRDSFGDPNAVSFCGMTPARWHARGVRILARTALEAARDPLGNRVGQSCAVAARHRRDSHSV
jgi:hypothetical protein